jgi:broad specificity polyphosphatase/5'/3'-nucleotidase SurE
MNILVTNDDGYSAPGLLILKQALEKVGTVAVVAPDYFRARQKQMQYDQFRTQGWPIGSGVVESAANTVVHHRLKRPGRGRKREFAQAMLAALCELHSHRFEQAWQA